jgi:uridine phosphorylase
MPARLRPTAPIAADAILVGDPGRALLLAQALLEQPKMSNHARGLWGYSGRTPAGAELTIQSTGMGGPSAAIVLADLAELGVRRAIRVGTCAAIDPALAPGNLLVAKVATQFPGSFVTEQTTKEPRNPKGLPDARLTDALARALGGEARRASLISVDLLPGAVPRGTLAAGAADMQTAALFLRGAELGVAVAALLIVTENEAGHLSEEGLEAAARRGGTIASAVLSA